MRSVARSMERKDTSGDALPLPGDETIESKVSHAPFHIRWGGIGYAVGLALFVPMVLWMAEPQPPDNARETAPFARLTAGKVQSSLASAPTQASRYATPPSAEPTQVLTVDPARERLDAAIVLIEARSFEQARSKLQPLSEAGHPEALFLLAGTFDPVQLAALGVTGVRAEAERARHLYEQALAAGYEPARGRLEQLK